MPQLREVIGTGGAELARKYIKKMGTKSEFHEDRKAQPISRLTLGEGSRGAASPPQGPADVIQDAMASRL